MESPGDFHRGYHKGQGFLSWKDPFSYSTSCRHREGAIFPLFSSSSFSSSFEVLDRRFFRLSASSFLAALCPPCSVVIVPSDASNAVNNLSSPRDLHFLFSSVLLSASPPGARLPDASSFVVSFSATSSSRDLLFVVSSPIFSS